MASGVFFIPDIEHEGDIQHCRSIIQDNGGDIVKVVWNGEPDDDAYIVFSASSIQQVNNIKSILQDG
ncbi:MAG: hypothetical protein MJY74_01750 [Bacteroidaceae bacterium]|nr:hypothetical protein [Bacteroidaceae bacterium]